MVRWLKRGVFALLVLLVIAFAAGWWLLRGSLPSLDGTIDLPGLSAPVSIERDNLGVVTIHAANEIDAMRALGYVHGQERFFEMDLLRRSAAGELAALVGPSAVELDKEHRVHRLRARVLDHLDATVGNKMPQLRAYTEGVNAGLAALKVRPWPYLLLGVKPEPWQLADTPLAGDAMYFDLQGGKNEHELTMWKIRQHIPPALYALLTRDGTSWDAPLMGQPRGDATLPDAATLDLRKLSVPGNADAKAFADSMSPGSNNFAVSGALTRDGRAIVADDMHLDLRAPDIWFRARLLYSDPKAADGKVDISGFTLPGIPAVIVGSNTHVAWAFTNSYGDWMDWLRVRYTGPDRTHYCCEPSPVPGAAAIPAPVKTYREQILVKGGSPQTLLVREVREGPILIDDPDGTSLALQWAAQQPGSLNLDLIDLATAQDQAQALAIAGRVGIPTQNFVVGDRAGHIAWTLIGRLPIRLCDGTQPVEISEHGQGVMDATRPCGWIGWMDAPSVPKIIDPTPGRLWTANNRTLDGEPLALVGEGGYTNGARPRQIRDDLFAKNQFTEKDLLAVQLDDRALFLTRWHTLLQDTAKRAHTPALTALASAARTWDGRADPSSVSYRLVRAWRLDVLSSIRDGLLAPAEAALGKGFKMPDLPQLEGVAWPMVTQLPDNLLPRRFSSWNDLFEDAAKQVNDEIGKNGPLDQQRWGKRNTASICHPLAAALPALFRRWLCMPPDELPGDAYMPRVASPDFGASERMVVSPGHEADGIIEMPGGQSGNPLSPFWGAGHEAWVHGEATPFLPGPAIHTLQLSPGR